MNTQAKGSFTAYFDTNVYDHIYKRCGITDEQAAALLKAAEEKRLRILVGDVNVEELLLTVTSDRSLARDQIALLLELTDVARNLLRPHELLATGDLLAYASGTPPPPRAADRNLQRLLAANLRLFAKNWELPSGFTDSLEATKLQKEAYKTGMDRARAEVSKVKPSAAPLPSFEEYRSRISPGLARNLAKRAGVEESCEQRGIDGLLDVKTIGMSCDANASLVYAQTFEGRTPKASDSRDVIHAVLATAADVFVTEDSKFRHTLSRVPLRGLTVMSLAELLSAI